MPFAAVVSVIAAGVTVLVLAAYLIRVALILWHVDHSLGTINRRLFVVVDKTEPVGPVVAEINHDLAEVDDTIHTVLGKPRTSSSVAMPVEDAPETQPISAPEEYPTRNYLR